MKWTQEELDKLITLYPQGFEICMATLGKSRGSIKSMACRLNITEPKCLTEDEINYLKQHGSFKSIKSLSKEMKRNWQTIGKCIKKLGIKFNNPQGKWIPNKEDIQVLRSDKSLIEMSQCLKRSIPSIRLRMREMSLIIPVCKRVFTHKPRACKSEIMSPSIPCAPRSGGEDRISEALNRLGL